MKEAIELTIRAPTYLRTHQQFDTMTELYEFLRPRFENKMWRGVLPGVFFQLAKDGHFAGHTAHWSFDVRFPKSNYVMARAAAKTAGFIHERIGSDELVLTQEAIECFATEFDRQLGLQRE